jgi:hypothetical protein
MNPKLNTLKKLRMYYTGLISWDWSKYPSAPYKGKGWTVSFERTRACGLGTTYEGKKKMENREVTINAYSFNRAQNALELITSAILLSTGQPLFAEIEVVIPRSKKECLEIFGEGSIVKCPRIGASHFPLACMIAAKASYRRAYALTKFGFASGLHSVARVDIDPSCATEHLGVSPFASSHVRYAYSIIASYSVIEEIGLEVRASSSRPSMINGEWNPVVREDLEQRLRRSGVNINETFPWDLRGKPTRIEKRKRLPSKGKCSWAKGPYVRDCELEIIDAINIASFLRSGISSHRMNRLASSLTSYDVENVRMLARRLLLSRLGFWRPPWH